MNDAPAASPTPAAPGAYDYVTHSGPRLMSRLVVAVLLYALLDTFFLNAYAYMVAPPALMFVAVGVAVFVIAALATRAAPRLEQISVSVLLALMVSFASYPLASRIDQWTDDNGPQLVAYEYDGMGRFHSATGSPDLDFTASPVIWPLNAGDSHEFELTQGALGFQQVNLSRIRKELGDGRVSLTPVVGS